MNSAARKRNPIIKGFFYYKGERTKEWYPSVEEKGDEEMGRKKIYFGIKDSKGRSPLTGGEPIRYGSAFSWKLLRFDVGLGSWISSDSSLICANMKNGHEISFE